MNVLNRIIKMLLTLAIIFFFGAITINSQNNIEDINLSLTKDGFIPGWLAVGPFEQPIIGFGQNADEDKVNEKTTQPFDSKTEISSMVKNGKVEWGSIYADKNNFIDFNNSLNWQKPAKQPERIWETKAGYAVTYINSPSEREALLLTGSNSGIKIYLNHKKVFYLQQNRNVVPDQDTIHIKLKKGRNVLLIKVFNSHQNLTFGFFGELKWQWGFYARVVDKNGDPFNDDLSISIPVKNKKTSFDIVSTFFFKKFNGKLMQRFDVVINSYFTNELSGDLKITLNNQTKSFKIKNIKFGKSRHHIYLPELSKDEKTNCELIINNEKINKEINLYHQKHYELYLMLLAHTDIGYTNTQPVVKEMHINTLDSVISLCDKYPDFKWTIETVWQLEKYEHARPKKMFQKLINYIKDGKISVSPIYSNPYTGQVSYEEMIQAFAKADEYKKKYGIKFNAAVYNDVPGQAWFVPEALNNFGIKFLADGINEVYTDYKIQRNLPKVFYWESPSGSKVVTYRDEAYNEGRSYGLEKGNKAVEDRLWIRINKLEDYNYPYEMILLNSAYLDNYGIATDQFLNAKKWNEEYEYPKIISSNLSEFAEKFIKKYSEKIPTLKGDFTSRWDVFGQGEQGRMSKQRWVQHNLLSAEKLSTLSWMLDEKQIPFNNKISKAYSSLLNYSGHGSGLEFGYGSPKENKITMDFRGSYLNDAFFKTEEVLERSVDRIARPEDKFESEGVLVFNTLSWERDAPVEIQFPEINLNKYQVIDLTTNKIVPSYRDGYKLFFAARNLPSLGYKKFQLKSVNKKSDKNNGSLNLGKDFIENNFYKISFNPANGSIKSIFDKKNHRELIDNKSFSFGKPITKKIDEKEYKSLKLQNIKVNIMDERPVRVGFKIIGSGIFESIKYYLWENLDRVDISYYLNLEKLKTPKRFEEYDAAFPFALNNPNVFIENLGGFINPDKDLLPGISKTDFSIRRSVSISNQQRSVTWAAINSRIIHIDSLNNKKILIANLVNNFPKDWNRNEENEGKINLNFSFTSQKGEFNPAFTSKFGWEINTPLVTRKSWYGSKDASKSFLKINNENIILLTMKSDLPDNAILLRLMNINNEKTEESLIGTKIFKINKAFITNYFGENGKEITVEKNSFNLKLKPNEISTVKLNFSRIN